MTLITPNGNFILMFPSTGDEIMKYYDNAFLHLLLHLVRCRREVERLAINFLHEIQSPKLNSLVISFPDDHFNSYN